MRGGNLGQQRCGTWWRPSEWDLDEALRRASRIKNFDFVSDKDSLRDYGTSLNVIKLVDGLVVSDFASELVVGDSL